MADRQADGRTDGLQDVERLLLNSAAVTNETTRRVMC